MPDGSIGFDVSDFMRSFAPDVMRGDVAPDAMPNLSSLSIAPRRQQTRVMRDGPA
jgi:hypothetical protein